VGIEIRQLGRSGARQIATEKAKHDPDYQERVGIVDGPAKDLARRYVPAFSEQRNAYTEHWARWICAYRLRLLPTALHISLKPTPTRNSESQEFATAALYDGLDYTTLLHRILTLGISRQRQRICRLNTKRICAAIGG